MDERTLADRMAYRCHQTAMDFLIAEDDDFDTQRRLMRYWLGRRNYWLRRKAATTPPSSAIAQVRAALAKAQGGHP